MMQYPTARPGTASDEPLLLELGAIAARAAESLADAGQGAAFYARALERFQDSFAEPSAETLDAAGFGISLANGLLRELHVQLRRELTEAQSAIARLRLQF